MDESSRTCRRTGCRGPAAASLSFRYATRQAWLVELAPRAEPALYDLCPRHADTLTVPRGWQRVDDRRRAPAAAGRPPDVPEPGGSPGRGAALASSRYGDLWAQLPRLAAQLAERGDEPLAGHVEIEGQLRIPVEGVGEEPGELAAAPAGRGGVVVPFGTRRGERLD